MFGIKSYSNAIKTISAKKYFSFSYSKPPINVSITGACGNIGYAIAFRVAGGDMFGNDQPVNLKLIEIPECENKLKGIKLELDDCSFPLLNSVTPTTSLSEGFKDCDYAILIGIKATVKSGERVDGLTQNASILVDDGKALNDNANKDCKVLVLANPANTNCLLAMSAAPRLKKENFHAITRLDHNRALKRLSQQFNCHTNDISNLCIWGNHDATMFADLTYATVNGELIKDKVTDLFVKNEFPFFVANRWKEILYYRGLTSCASAANAAIDHAHDWYSGTKGKWISKGVYQTGKYYNIPEGIIFSMPCIVDENGVVKVVDNLELNDYQREKLRITAESLLYERRVVEKYL